MSHYQFSAILSLLLLLATTPILAETGFLTLPFNNDAVIITEGWLYDEPGSFSCAPFGTLCHKGIDYARSDGGEFAVLAGAPGQAVASVQEGYGNFILVRHNVTDALGRHYFTLYAHLKDASWGVPNKTVQEIREDIRLSRFERWLDVERGEPLATAGSTGVGQGIHLHFEAQVGGYAQNKTDPYDIYDQNLSGRYPSACGPAYLWVECPPTTPRSILLFDDFEDGDLTEWTFKTFGSNSFTASWGLVQDGSTVLELAGGTANGGGDVIAYRPDFSGQDYAVSAEVKVHEVRNGGHHSGVVARYTDDLNFYELSVNQFQSHLRLLGWENGKERDIAVVQLAPSILSTWIDLKLEVIGNQLRAYVNDDLYIDTTDFRHLEGHAGVVNSGSVTRFDGFRVESRRVTFGPGIAFEDDFNDGVIDRGMWITEGFTVSEQGGELRVDVTRTDAGGTANTGHIRIDPERPIVVERRFKVHYGNDKFDGQLRFRPRNHEERVFGISYAHYFFDRGAECTTDHWAIFRNNVNTHQCPARFADTSVIDGVWWDQWVTESVHYDPLTGVLVYLIDGTEQRRFDVGSLPEGVDSISLRFGVWGWFTGHYQHMDWVLLRQE